MNIEKLTKGNLITAEIEKQKKALQALNGEMGNKLLFYVDNPKIGNFRIGMYEFIEYNGFEQQVQMVLMTTKQTLISILERDIKRLEKEFNDL